jgi:competence protein ComEA
VHVTGAVRSPGVFRLASDARVVDAVAAAGGTTPLADTVAVNFAATLVDGAQVFIPLRGRATTTTTPRPKPGVNPPPTPTMPTPVGTPTPPAGSTSSGPIVNLNTASLTELDSLPGIGPSTAQAIIDYRVVKGRFKSVEDLLNVRGIGEAKLAAIRSRVGV